jgi:TetR/AcrR family transcriptional regulator, regulator of autoinduction and epiphytic fitness
MTDGVKAKRRYNSERRQEQARATRAGILDAALRRFAVDGYVATTMAAIAEEARVAAPTVYVAFKTKPALLAELITQAIFGSEPAWSPATERSWYQQLAALDDPRDILRQHAAYLMEVNRKVAPIQFVAEGAAAADADIAALWRRTVQQRMQGQQAVAQLLEARGSLAPGLTVQHAADLMWALSDARLYHSLVVERGWSQSAFEHWLDKTLRSSILRCPVTPRN